MSRWEVATAEGGLILLCYITLNTLSYTLRRRDALRKACWLYCMFSQTQAHLLCLYTMHICDCVYLYIHITKPLMIITKYFLSGGGA